MITRIVNPRSFNNLSIHWLILDFRNRTANSSRKLPFYWWKPRVPTNIEKQPNHWVHGNWSFPSIHILIKRSQLVAWIWLLDVGSTTSNHLHVLQIVGGYLYHLLLVFRCLIRCNQFPALLVVDPVDIRYPSGFPFPAVMDTMSHGYNSVTQCRYCII
jgi:hypothetical protein